LVPAIDHFARAGRNALGHEREGELASFIRGFALLLGVEAEARLAKLLYEPSGFADAERASVSARPTQAERWETALELAFRRPYGVATAPLTEKALPHSAFRLQRAVFCRRRCSVAFIISVKSAAGRISKTLPYVRAGCCTMSCTA
jgi:hypothetical protein